MKSLALARKPIETESVQPIIETACAALVEATCPFRVYLFGSAAENRLTDQSDLDFLVVYDDDVNLKDLQKHYYQTRSIPGMPIEIVWITRSVFMRKKDIGGVCMIANQDGKLLYDRENQR